MSLHHKILLVIFSTFVGLILALYWTTNHIVLNSFASLEKTYILQDATNIKEEYLRLQTQLGRKTLMLAKLKDARLAPAIWNPGFSQSFFQAADSEDLDVDFHVVLGAQNRILSTTGFNMFTMQGAGLLKSLRPILSHDSPILPSGGNRAGQTGLVRLPMGLALVSMHTIIDTHLGDAPTSYTVLMASRLRVEETTKRINPHVSTVRLRELTPAEIGAAAAQTTRPDTSATSPITIAELGDARIRASMQLNDIHGNPIAELSLEQPRTIYQQGHHLLSYFVLFLLLIGLVFSLLMTYAVKKLMLDRLTRMNARLKRISAQGDTTARLKLRGQDEMATLGAAINQMLDSLVKADQELLHLNDNLESMVSARTIDLALTNEALRKEITERQRAEMLLNQAHQRKDEFLAMLAHELRNPLAPIRTITRLLQQTEGGDRNRRRRLDVIERQVAHMSRLLDDLLDVSRITQGKIELRRDRVDLRQVLDNVLETMRSMMREQGLEVDYQRPPEALWLEGDATRLEQVFYNLIHNAVKYSDGAGTIGISVATETAPGQDSPVATVRIQDSGIGIDATVLPHIFDLFVQADRSLDRTRGGLGLGLTLVERLVRMHGGTVAAKSEGLGRGSEFSVQLPLFAAEPGQVALPTGCDTPQEEEWLERASLDNSGELRKVLVVEDNLDTASSMAELLEVWGYQVRVAYDGPMAVDMAKIFAPEVVLLDIGLPQVDGYEVARRLREAGAVASMTIVALTGYSQDEDRQRAREAGCNLFLAKPVDLDALRGVLEHIQQHERPAGLEHALE